jgi:hypothetical protein
LNPILNGGILEFLRMPPPCRAIFAAPPIERVDNSANPDPKKLTDENTG